jgi:hypothetical protein
LTQTIGAINGYVKTIPLPSTSLDPATKLCNRSFDLMKTTKIFFMIDPGQNARYSYKGLIFF